MGRTTLNEEIVVPFGDLETSIIEGLIPPFFFSYPEELTDGDINLFKELFFSFYSNLEHLELVPIESTMLYDKIENPLLGFICFTRGAMAVKLKTLARDKTIIIPITNIGQLQYNLTVKDAKFRKALKKLYPEHRWLKTNVRVKRVFSAFYRRELYHVNSKKAELPQFKRLWRSAKKRAGKAQHWRADVFLWGLRRKDTMNLLPDYRVFL